MADWKEQSICIECFYKLITCTLQTMKIPAADNTLSVIFFSTNTGDFQMITMNVQVTHPQAAHRKMWKLTNPTKVQPSTILETDGKLGLKYLTRQQTLRDGFKTWQTATTFVPWMFPDKHMLQQILPLNRGYVQSPPQSPDMFPRKLPISKNGTAPTGMPFPGLPWNSGTTANRPTHNCKKSGSAGLLVVDPLHKLKRWLTLQGTTMTNNKGKHTLPYWPSPGNFK